MPAASTAPLVSDSRSAASARCADSGPSTTTAVSASPSAASTASCQPAIDLDQVEHRAEHAVDCSETLGAGAGVSGIERELQRLDAGTPPGGDVGRRVPLCGASLDRRVGSGARLLGTVDLLDQRRLDRLGPGTVVAEALDLLGELGQPCAELVAPGGRPAQLALAALDAVPDRPQLTAHFGGGAGGTRAPVVGSQRLGDVVALGLERFLVDP